MITPANPGRSASSGRPWLLILLVLFLLLFFPPPAKLPPAGYRALLVAAAAIVLWTSELLPLGMTGIVTVVLLALTGAAPTLKDALYGFSHPISYFLIGVLTFGIAVEKVGLAERLARFFLRRSRGGYRSLFWQMILSFPLLAFVLPSAITRSAIMTSIYDRALSLGGLKKGAPLARAVMMGLCSINRLASTTLLTGGITPIVGAALIGGIGWTWWFLLLGIPYYLTLGVGSLSIYLWYLRGEDGRLSVPEEASPPFSREERRASIIVLGASAVWLTDAFHQLHPALAALAGWTFLLMPGVGVLKWREFETRFPWANFFVLASSISLGQALVDSGASRWLARTLLEAAPAIASRPYLLLATILLASIPVRFLVPNIAGFLAITIPLAMEMGRGAGLNPVVCGLGVMIIGDTVLFYAAQSGSSLVVYERGHLSADEILYFGLYMTLVGFAAMMTFNLLWWNALGMSWLGG